MSGTVWYIQEAVMVKSVIFDMYETLVTLYAGAKYFGAEIAVDSGIKESVFQRAWHLYEDDRSTGKMTLRQILDKILRDNCKYSEEVVDKIIGKRIRFQEAAFDNIREDIFMMLESIKKRGISIGLISNCFSDEAEVIERSSLYPFFDAVCLSWYEGVQKPDKEIFRRCVERFGVSYEECVYIGDGGSYELETAESLGMRPGQAVWYFADDPRQQRVVRDRYIQLGKPMDVLELL